MWVPRTELRFGDTFLYSVCRLTDPFVVSLRQVPNNNKYETPCCLEITGVINTSQDGCVVVEGVEAGSDRVVSIWQRNSPASTLREL